MGNVRVKVAMCQEQYFVTQCTDADSLGQIIVNYKVKLKVIVKLSKGTLQVEQVSPHNSVYRGPTVPIL